MKDKLQQVRDALADCKSELWDDWHSDMSECDFENHWLIMDIDKATKKLDRLIAEHEGKVLVPLGMLQWMAHDDANYSASELKSMAKKMLSAAQQPTNNE